MNAVIVVPFRPDGEIRSRNWEFCEDRWRALGLPICEGDGRRDEPFDVTRARNAAVAGATQAHPEWEVALMTDADAIVGSVLTAHGALVEAWATGKYVVAHNRLVYLNEADSEQMMKSMRPSAEAVRGAAIGTWETVFAFRRDLWDTIGGFDPRFRGFGHQVEAFFHAAETLVETSRMTGFCYHLWHPYSADQHNPHLEKNRELVERYWAASGDEPAMRELLAEYVVAG